MGNLSNGESLSEIVFCDRDRKQLTAFSMGLSAQ